MQVRVLLVERLLRVRHSIFYLLVLPLARLTRLQLGPTLELPARQERSI
jgi:hypothetical protein